MRKFLLLICFIFIVVAFVCINVSAEDGVPILEDGVYEIENWYTLEDLAVKDFGIDLNADIVCYYDNHEYVNRKNSLWLVTHLGDNYYSFRPIHCPTWGLAVFNNQIFHYLLGTDLQDVHGVGQWKVEAHTNNAGMILTNKYFNKVLALAENSSQVEFVDTFSGHPLERWYFSKLTASEAQSLEGVIIYGKTAVVGQTTTLQARLYSSLSLNQSVTYNSNYICANTTSSGSVTGVYEGIIGVGATSNADPNCKGYAKIAIVNNNRSIGDCTYLNGVPDNVEPGHDHLSALQTISEYLDNISELTFLRDDFSSPFYDDIALCEMITAKAYVFRGHGSKDAISFGNGGSVNKSDFATATNRCFSNTQLILYMTCSTGEGGHTGNNLVVATYKQGVKNVIGFEDVIYCNEANLWIDTFFGILCDYEGDVYSYNTIETALTMMDSYGFENQSVARSNILFMYNIGE